MLALYSQQTKCLVALDSIIFGFDGEKLKLLLVKRGIETEKDVWSLMGGWLQTNENLDQAAKRILKELTGLDDIYLEQASVYGAPERDPVQRTVAITYFALINVADYETKISDNFHAKWFALDELPELLFDHATMVSHAIHKLRNKAAFHPVGFELLPEKFTIPQLQTLYEAIFDTKFDKRNFNRKINASGLLLKQEDKQKGFSRKGAYYYRLNPEKYKSADESLFYFIPNLSTLV